MTDQETLDIYDACAQDYADNFCADTVPDTQLQSFIDALAPRSEVLDLGCGPGRSAGLLAKAGHIVTATDASSEMIRLAGQQDGVTARLETFDALGGDAIYDGIWANFSLLHADPEKLPEYVSTIGGMLRGSGIFHIAMKMGSGVARDGIGRRYTYVSQEEITAMLEGAGLRVFAQWIGEGAGLAGTVEPWFILQARKDG